MSDWRELKTKIPKFVKYFAEGLCIVPTLTKNSKRYGRQVPTQREDYEVSNKGNQQQQAGLLKYQLITSLDCQGTSIN